MAEHTEQAGRTDVSPLRSWIIRHPITTFLVLVYATTTALVFVPRALTEPGLLPGGATPHGARCYARLTPGAIPCDTSAASWSNQV
jgi:hypothetical protein